MMRNFFNRKASDMNAGNGDAGAPDQDAVPENEANIEDIVSGAADAPASDAASKLVRLQADFDNYRRRNASARQEGRDEARREMLLSLLPIFDNFMRALAHAREEEADSNFIGGIDGIRLQFEEFFRREGLEFIEASPGTEFDPNLHDATGTIPSVDDDDQSNTIARELLKGFVYKGQVLRPTQVLVYGGD